MIIGGSRNGYVRSVLTETPAVTTEYSGNTINVFGDNKFAKWESGSKF